jgi:DNA-binding transcriptional ArsR family regulator
MIRIRLDEWTLARTRIAISPLNELVNGLYLLVREQGHVSWPYTEWAHAAREVLATTPEVAPARLYAQVHGPAHARPVPDLFTPIPQSASPSLDEELAVLRQTPRTVVEEQFGKHHPGGVPPFLTPFLDDPRTSFGRLADALAVYWERAVAPHWPAMRTALEEETLLRARVLAAEGPGAVLAGLQGRVRWEPPVLSLVKRVESAVDTAGQRLLLVPQIFAQDILMCSTDHPDITMISYQARGSAVLTRQPRPRPVDGLAILLGPGRAAVLRALLEPATTAGLATTLGLASSTVSEHLATLLAAGVVHRRRSGRRVLYGLEPSGAALLTLLSGEQTRSAG